jgi:hypothetical protein
MASKLPLFLVLPFAISCGGDDTPHTIKTPDSNMGSGSGSQTVTDECKVMPTYTTLSFAGSNANANATEVPAGSNAPHRLLSWGAMETVGSDTVSADYVNLELWAQLGGFGSGDIGSGTYVITGDDADVYACGICLYIQGDYLLENEDGTADDWLMASSGTVNITSVTGSSYQATVSNADFRRITNMATENFPDPDGGDQTDTPCTTHVDSITFDIPLKHSGSGSGSGSAVGKPGVSNLHGRVLHHRRY